MEFDVSLNLQRRHHGGVTLALGPLKGNMPGLLIILEQLVCKAELHRRTSLLLASCFSRGRLSASRPLLPAAMPLVPCPDVRHMTTKLVGIADATESHLETG